MNTLDRKVDGKTLLREQCYVCWMTPTDAPPPAGKTAADVRTDHFAYLLELERSGVLFAAGPFVDEDGVRHGAGMLLVRAASRAGGERKTPPCPPPTTRAGTNECGHTRGKKSKSPPPGPAFSGGGFF